MSKRKPNGYWTLERCMEDAAQYSSQREWSRRSSGAYQRASANGWREQCCAHMASGNKPRGYWTLERCMEDAAKYGRRSEWKSASKGAYLAAMRKGWLEACCGHMSRTAKPRGYWKLETCIEDASKYSSSGEWRANSGAAYAVAWSNGWLDQCCAHMEALHCGTDNDVIYIWRDAGSDLHKVGVTSARIGEGRVGICSSKHGMDPHIVFMLKVDDARAVESQLLKLGTDPELDSSIDGYTEFRVLSNDDLREAVSIAYEAALAA